MLPEEAGQVIRFRATRAAVHERYKIMSKQFQETLLKHLPQLRAYAMTLTRNHSDADDLAQSTASRILKYESQFEVGSNFAAWSYRILKNNHISNCRRNKHRIGSLDEFPEGGVQPVALVSPPLQEQQMLTREVIRALDKLTPHSRETMALVCGAQLSYDEVAVIMSCSIGTVKSRLWRARAQMKTLLMGDGDEGNTSRSRPVRAKSTWNAPLSLAC